MTKLLGFMELVLVIGAAVFAWLAIDGAAINASYAAFLTACLGAVELLRRRETARVSEDAQVEAPNSALSRSSRKARSGVGLRRSEAGSVRETRDSVPLGLQTISLKYGPKGDALPLNLKDTAVRAEIQLRCRITNPYRALFGAHQYALDALVPRFLYEARQMLEVVSLRELREQRREMARDITGSLAPAFEELGVRLESVTIGSLTEI